MTANIGKMPTSSVAALSAQDFFLSIYTQLRAGQISSALEALNQGKSTQSSLTDSNVQTITDFVKGENLPDDQRAKLTAIDKANRLVKLIKGKPKAFVGVNAELFTSSIRAGQVVVSKAMPATNDAHSKTLEKVKALGKQAGLSEQEVNDALEETVEEDGSRT